MARMSDELKRLVELAERQEQREVARSRYWRNFRWMVLVVIVLVFAFSTWLQIVQHREAERMMGEWRQQTDALPHEMEQRARDTHQ
jgi:hypothetical protein